MIPLLISTIAHHRSSTSQPAATDPDPRRPSLTELRSVTGAPRLPPFSSPVGPLIPWLDAPPPGASVGSGGGGGSGGEASHSAPIAIPSRRASEPVRYSHSTTSPRAAASGAGAGAGVGALPGYTPTPASPADLSRPAIPSYELALSQSPPRSGSTPMPPLTPGPGSSSLSPGSGPAGWGEDTWVRDYFGRSPAGRALPTVDDDDEDGEHEGVEMSALDEEDDPLLPRVRPRGPLEARRYTISGASGFGASPSHSSTAAPHSVGNEVVHLPAPTAEPPAYHAELGQDELRLISTVHLSRDHLASAFFNAITSQPHGAGAGAAPSAGASGTGAESGAGVGSAGATEGPALGRPGNMTTGRKKLRLTVTRGGERMNANGTGPMFVRMGRGGVIEGSVTVGNVDHAVGLEIAILGLVNTSYYIRGQYTLLDTLPLVRSATTLFPPAELDPDCPRMKDGSPVISPNSTFTFTLPMPSSHYKDEDVELPPSCEILQIGLQASVEYVLRVKLSRKGWRMSEVVALPIIYEPRAYVAPRRLRALTLDDPLNPGWRTIRLHGGEPLPKSPSTDSIQVSLLLPSPPILFVTPGQPPPPIPFHLHFHCPLALPLKTFSDPRECTFVVRMQRVASIRIGAEKEVRRSELPSRVELWEDGGEVIVLGDVARERHAREHERRASASASAVPAAGGSPLRRTSTGGSASGEGKKRAFSFSDRRPSFSLRRRSSGQQGASASSSSSTAPTTIPSSSPPAVSSIMEHQPLSLSPTGTPTPNDPPSSSASSLNVVPLSTTDVHLHGILQLANTYASSPEMKRKMTQSFTTPEIGLSYVLEVGIQPQTGAVKEAFGHVWGGGLVEVVIANV
ncbi:hypothetical protein IAT38_000579 [Cryptococcus sp. DSM 104549]